MQTLSTLPDLGKAFQTFINTEMLPPVTICSHCGTTYHNPEQGNNNPLKLPSLVKLHERPNNLEAYPYWGCPECGTDDYLK